MFDRDELDGAVTGLGRGIGRAGRDLSRLETGYLRQYAAYVLVGVLVDSRVLGVAVTPGPLTLLIVLPLLGAVVAASALSERGARAAALTAMLAVFAAAAWVWAHFAPGSAALQFEERAAWVSSLGLGYHLGVDGLSVSLVALVAFLFPIALVASRDPGARAHRRRLSSRCCCSRPACSARSWRRTWCCSTCSGKRCSFRCTS